MKLIITKENLIKALQKIIGVVEKRQTMPILSHILFRKNGESFEAVASDLEFSFPQLCLLKVESDFTESITIPGRKLFDIGKGLPDEAIIEIEEEGEGKLKIKSKKVNLFCLL